jgi:myo-inositol-1(or 4)-monophosphatase
MSPTQSFVLVKKLFPEANVISEEEATRFSDDAPCTFILDPIDGDGNVQPGFFRHGPSRWESWTNGRNPTGAMIDAPRFGMARDEMFLRLDPGHGLLLDDMPFLAAPGKDTVRQVTIGSGALKHICVSGFPGKIRCFGSSILHLVAPVVFPGIQACAEFHGYAWDVAASHAILRSQGMDIVHADGSILRYDEPFWWNESSTGRPVYAGTKAATDFLRDRLTVTC